ncbi:DUF2971 domain-containing protein [Erwinia billingiae]|uniref:DUF2971 domain-containing protein n=1 Tax=Erwinia billingiae TaxID=182337 RepID=UPI0022464EB9|nr:DUF2971 domain-containing protein [Erwinia billingiae]MCX0501623.1 DUF2971 domain-containing protein [Erwinia billingiae]
MNLYHYTDLNAVHSILDMHKIRMTDIRFLNDKTEYLQGLEILKEASHEIFLQDSKYDKEFANVVDGWFKEAFKELFDFENAIEMFYVASFSRSSDTLSQWRSYGMFAIEFDGEKLQDRVSKWAFEKRKSTRKLVNFEFIECHYVFDKNDAIVEASELIRTKAIDAIYDWWQPNSPIKQNIYLYRDLRETISMLATTFKHDSFNEEQEVRLVISDKIVSKQIKFRTKNTVLIPFYELDVSAEVISGVKIGPVEDQRITEQSLYIYNLHRAAKLGGDKYILNIETSDIPYRTL